MNENAMCWGSLLQFLPRNSTLCRGILGTGMLGGYLMNTGSGPCDVGDFDDFLSDCGLMPIDPSELGDNHTLGVLVVGQEGWTPECLDRIVQAHAGKRLRVYSQEMVIASMALGKDVFEEMNPEDLQRVFGDEGHPALDYLREERGFAWPSTTVEVQPSAITVNFTEFDAPGTGFLSFMGYHVGKNSELSDDERRTILDYVMRVEIQPALDADRIYAAEWGPPMSTARLQKAANCISTFTRLRKRNKSHDFSVAIEEWESDLEYLRQTYYSKLASRFSWPDTEVP